MRNLIRYWILLLNLLTPLSPAQNEEIIARAGSSVITLEEFKNRYQFMPHLNFYSSDPDSLRKEFLYSLIAEKLWAMEAVELNLDTIEAFKYSIDNLRKLLVKDELYREEVESKINISNQEVLEGLYKHNRILKINIISTSDSVEIFRISEAIKSNTDSIKTSSALFDSILSLRKEYEIQKEPLDLPFGKLQEEDIEETLFSMPHGTISEPVKTGDGWFIFRIKGEEKNPAVKPSTEEAKNNVLSIIKERRTQKLSGQFIDKLIGGRSISADGKIFETLYKNLVSVLKGKDLLESEYELTSRDIYQLMNNLNDSTLTENFIRLENNPLTAKDFLYYLFYQRVVFSSFHPNISKSVLNEVVRQFIEDEIIYREGINRGLEQRENIKEDLRIWKDYHLSQLLMNNYSDSIHISDDEMKNYYLKINKSPDSLIQVNIIEILTDDLDIVKRILDELENDKDFRDLAVRYTQREWTKDKGGEFGFFSVDENNEIGRIAAGMNVGEIHGPLKVPEGYSIFKLIGKKQYPDSLYENFKEMKDLIRTQLGLQKLTKLVINKTIYLADKFDVKIMEELLQETELIELNTFTYRLIGFGGRIAAFPITMPMFEWYEKYKDENVNP